MSPSLSLQIPSFFFSKRKSGVSPLSKLKPQELESLGLKAVGKGADPGDLQDAFAKAQVLSRSCSDVSGILELGNVWVFAQLIHMTKNQLYKNPTIN